MFIAFIQNEKAFLPEINAYCRFFSNYGLKTEVASPADLKKLEPDVEWHFMGGHFHKSGVRSTIIHEYASASVPPFRSIKNEFKRTFIIQPDFRLFLNEYVKDQFHYDDGVPYGFRDMGIDPAIFFPLKPGKENKEYDFIYCGSVTRDLKVEKLINHFTSVLKDRTLLIVSNQYDYLRNQFNNTKNISFTGPVPQADIPLYLNKASFAINYKPDVEPHNRQTVTKLLEYAACQVPVVTSDLLWVRQFQENYGGNYFYLEDDLSNFTWQNINGYAYSFPDLTDWTWKSR